MLLPGLVDLHTHLREPGREDTETIATGSAAAALGGFTAVHAMANTDPVADTAEIVEQVARRGARGRAGRRPAGRRGVARAWPARRWPRSATWPARPPRVRVFSDDGRCVHDARLMRRALEYVKPFDAVVAQHAQDPRLADSRRLRARGRAVRPARAARLARGRRGVDHRPRRHAGRAHRLAAARLPRLDRRLGRGDPLGQGSAASPSPPRSRRTTCCSPATCSRPTTRCSRSTRRCARPTTSRRCAPGWPTARSTPSPPTTPRTPRTTRTTRSATPRSACSACRPRSAWSPRRWSTTGLLDWAGVADRMSRAARPRSAGSPGTAAPIAVGAPANLTLVDPAGGVDGRPGRAGVAGRATPRSPGGRCRPAVVATFLRGRLDRAATAQLVRRGAGMSARSWCSRTAARSAARPTARSARRSARRSSTPA